MAFNKIVLLLVAALAAPLAVTQAAGAPIVPAWCSCGDIKSKTQTVCAQAGGNWDGGSCGLAITSKWWAFYNGCGNLGSQARCWN
ncbi:hypothetical protein BGX28_000674 [Mortierella sp. GBA30]|nr:hypothetical protein BGX28_000674 [Mortierella sp. GBA30]